MATSIVTIDAPDNVVTCDAEGSAQHVFNVKNTSGRALTVGVKVLVDAPTEEAWLHVDTPAEQELGDDVLTQIPVQIQVPAEGAPGRYTYRLLVYSTRKAGEEFTEGEAVAFEVPQREPKEEPTPPPPNRWWIWAAVITGVLVIGGVLTWKFWPLPVPALEGQRFDLALIKIKEAGFTFDPTNLKRLKGNEANVGKVVGQEPRSGKAARGSEIVLTLGATSKGVIFTPKFAAQIKLKQPNLYMQIKEKMPRSIELAPE